MDVYYVGIPTRKMSGELEGYTRIHTDPDGNISLILFLNFPHIKIINGFPVKKQTINLK